MPIATSLDDPSHSWGKKWPPHSSSRLLGHKHPLPINAVNGWVRLLGKTFIKVLSDYTFPSGVVLHHMVPVIAGPGILYQFKITVPKATVTATAVGVTPSALTSSAPVSGLQSQDFITSLSSSRDTAPSERGHGMSGEARLTLALSQLDSAGAASAPPPSPTGTEVGFQQPLISPRLASEFHPSTAYTPSYFPIRPAGPGTDPSDSDSELEGWDGTDPGPVAEASQSSKTS